MEKQLSLSTKQCLSSLSVKTELAFCHPVQKYPLPPDLCRDVRHGLFVRSWGWGAEKTIDISLL